MVRRAVVAVGCKVTHGAGDAGGGGGEAQGGGGVSRGIARAGAVTGSHPYQAAAHNSGGYSGVWLRHSPRPRPVSVQPCVAACVVTRGALGGVMS